MEVVEGVSLLEVLALLVVLSGLYFAWAQGSVLLAGVSCVAVGYIALYVSTQRHGETTDA